MRSWVLNGWSQFYRQTLLFGSFPTAETNALLSKYCCSIHVFKDEGEERGRVEKEEGVEIEERGRRGERREGERRILEGR